MKNEDLEILKVARSLGFSNSETNVYSVRDWLREVHSIHVEVGSIWDEKTNVVEYYIYTITAPIYKFHVQPQCSGNGDTHCSMLSQGVLKGLEILCKFLAEKHLQVSDDQLVVAYLKGYGEKGRKRLQPSFQTTIEEYAYTLGKEGDYIEEGLTDDDIVYMVRNPISQEEQFRLQ